MKTGRSFNVFFITAAVLSLLAATAGLAFAEEQIRTQSMIQAQDQADEATALRLRLRSQLKKETGLTEEQLDDLDPLLAEALNSNGQDAESLRKMVRKSVQMDCVGDCLMDRLREHIRLQDPDQIGDPDQTAARERMKTRTQLMDGDLSGEQNRTEARSEGHAGDGTGGSSGGGGGGKGR